jgi:transposase-like protein
MPRGYPALTAKQKQEIVAKINDNGEKVSDLSKEYGVVPKTIYNLLKKQINQPNIALELAKVRRERDVLLQMVGQFVLDNKARKKNSTKNQF